MLVESTTVVTVKDENGSFELGNKVGNRCLGMRSIDGFGKRQREKDNGGLRMGTNVEGSISV